jgi:hypothetical protein
MVCYDQPEGYPPCQNGTPENQPTHWRHKDTGAPSPDHAPPAPATDTDGYECSKSNGIPPGYVYIHTSLPNAQLSNPDAYPKDHKCNNDFNTDLFTNEQTSGG